ncbi:MAG: hypothetical protein WDW36_007404 [Sanguina aurantia]
MTRVAVVLLMQLMAIQGTAACVAVTNASELVTLADIAGADGALPISLAQRMTLYDTDGVRKLMAGKRVTLLGDSSMAETAHDLVLLISGIGGSQELRMSYMQQAKHVWDPTRVCIPFPSPPDGTKLRFQPMDSSDGGGCATGTEVRFHGSHRNMTVTVPALDFCLRFRFTGHHELDKNNGGISTFFEPAFQAELHGLLHNPCGDGRPGVLVINSGLHDFGHWEHVRPRDDYESHMNRLGELLGRVRQNGTTVLWKGNLGPYATHSEAWRNVIPQEVMAAHKIPYIDTVGVFERLLSYYQLDCFTHDAKHFGMVAVTKSDGNKSILASSMVTQKIIADIAAALLLSGKEPFTL